jgi:pilus assembly protein CpaE
VTRIVLATASEAFERRVREAYEGALDGELRVWRDGLFGGEPATVVAELTRTQPWVVSVGPDLHPDAALQLVRAFDRERPEIVTIIVAEPSAQLWEDALRAGARDVLSPDIPVGDLRQALDRALETAQRRRATLGHDTDSSKLSRTISIVSPKGGSGKTTVATNLAVGLAQRAPGEVVVIDLDLQFGDVASALRLAPENTIADLAGATNLDSTTLKVFLTPHPADLFALCAPESLAQADDVDPPQLNHVVATLAQTFRYVVIDTAAGIDVIALAAMELSSDLVLVSTTDVPCVRSLRKAIEALDAIGLNTQRRHFLLNRADAKVGLSTSDIESVAGMAVDVSVPSSRAMWLSLNLGTPILESDPGSPAGKSMNELVARFAPDTSSRASVPGGSGGGLWRRKKGSQ